MFSLLLRLSVLLMRIRFFIPKSLCEFNFFLMQFYLQIHADAVAVVNNGVVEAYIQNFISKKDCRPL